LAYYLTILLKVISALLANCIESTPPVVFSIVLDGIWCPLIHVQLKIKGIPGAKYIIDRINNVPGY